MDSDPVFFYSCNEEEDNFSSCFSLEFGGCFVLRFCPSFFPFSFLLPPLRERVFKNIFFSPSFSQIRTRKISGTLGNILKFSIML